MLSPKGKKASLPRETPVTLSSQARFSSGQRLGLGGEGLGPHVVADDILGGVADVDVDGVVPVGLGHVVAEGQIQHLGHVAQLPVVGLLARQAGAVDAALLTGTHADGLAVLHVADAVGLGVLQHDQADDQIAALLGEGPGETRLFYCDPRRSDQKGACERNHVEIRKLLPKGAGIRFDRLAPADLALAMSHVNSEPRGALGFATPARAFRAMLGEDAAALLDAYGVEDVPLGDLDLTPGLIERARAERGDAPLA